MTCPIGYFTKKINENEKCWGLECDSNNRYDMLKCCNECEPVKNAKIYECNGDEGSFPLECDEGFMKKGIECVAQKDTFNIQLIFDGDYQEFIKNNDKMMVKTTICKHLQKRMNFSHDDCIKQLKIQNLEEGSIIINFSFTNDIDLNEKNSVIINQTELEEVFKKDTYIEEINKEVKEVNIFKNEDGLEKISCNSNIYRHDCPYLYKLKDNAFSIYGNTDNQCCELDNDILQVIVPIGLVILLFLIIVWKSTISKI